MKQDFKIFHNLGMNRNVSHFNIMTGEWRMILNADIDKVGRIKKRAGYQKFLDAPDASEILSIIPFNLNGANKLIMINAAGKLYSADTDATTWGTAILTGLSTSARWGYTTMADSGGTKYLLIGNGATIKKTSNGTTFTDVSGCPLAKYFTTLFQRVYAAGVTASPSTLFWSGTGDITDWDTVSSDSSSTDIEAGSKGDIKGLITSNDRVLIYKEKLLKRWNDEYMKTVMSSWGTEAPYSLAEIDGQIFSYDREGIRIYNGSYPVLSSFYIQDLIDGMSNSSANLERRFGLAYKDRYFLNAGNITDEDGKTISNAMIVYDYLKNMFTIYSFADVMTAGTKVIDKNGDEIVIFGDSSGQCYKMFTGDVDDDTNIEMKLESHIFYPQGIETEIEPSEIYIASENPSRMELSISGDFGEIIPQCQIEDYAQTIKINGVGHCRGVKIFITHAKKGRPIFNGFSLNYTLGER
jgi:hypothetical protein